MNIEELEDALTEQLPIKYFMQLGGLLPGDKFKFHNASMLYS